MRSSARGSWSLLVLAAVAGLPLRAAASHHVFSSSVDRFEVDGNTFGAEDGTLDFVDEFDNGTIAPDWSPLLGTNVESGGVVTLKNPGTDYTIGSVSVDVSNIENEDPVVDGSGDFTATTYWVPSLPATDQEFHFQLYELGSVIEAAGLSVGSASAAVPPGVVGPSITMAVTQVLGGSFNQSASVSIDPNDITGQIVLRISVDDATNMMTGSFSLDGGATFQSPFPPMPVFVGVDEYEFLLGAGVIESNIGPTPTPTPTATPTPLPTPQPIGMQLLSVKNPSGAAARKILYKVKDVGHTLVGDPTVDGATFNIKLDGTSQCFILPSLGWQRLGSSGFKFLNPDGTSGPVRLARIKKSGNNFRVKILISGKQGPVDVIPPNPGSQADTNLRIGLATYCSSSTGAAIGPNDDKTFKAKFAPPPAMCNLPPC
jgi:hypothetical protein